MVKKIKQPPKPDEQKKQLAEAVKESNKQNVPLPAQQEKPKITQPEVLKSGETGNIRGVTLPTGETYLGLKPSEVKELISGYQERTAIPQGAIGAPEAEKIRRQQILSAPLAGQIGIPAGGKQLQTAEGSIIPAQTPQLSISEALKSGAAQAAGGIAGGAAVGLATGGVASVPLAILGGIGGFVNGIRSNLKSQIGEQLSASKLDAAKIQTNLRALITDTNQHPEHALENAELFNTQLGLMQQKFSETKLLTQGNIPKFLGENGLPELERFELFYSAGGARDYLVRNMQEAIQNPNPAKVLVGMDDIEAAA